MYDDGSNCGGSDFHVERNESMLRKGEISEIFSFETESF